MVPYLDRGVEKKIHWWTSRFPSAYFLTAYWRAVVQFSWFNTRNSFTFITLAQHMRKRQGPRQKPKVKYDRLLLHSFVNVPYPMAFSWLNHPLHSPFIPQSTLHKHSERTLSIFSFFCNQSRLHTLYLLLLYVENILTTRPLPKSPFPSVYCKFKLGWG